MGVEKINHHKATRYHRKTGFREAFCPTCDQWVYVMSYPDDTRWRYTEHRAGSGESPRCETSRELVPTVPRRLF